MWTRGPFPASAADITIFRGGTEREGRDNWNRESLYFALPPGKKVIADSGYSGEPNKILLQSRNHPKAMSRWVSQVKARGETMHKILKSYNILKNRFYHGNNTEAKMNLHQMAVEAILVITQYSIENGHPLFDVQMT